MDQRLRFVARLLEGEKMAELCREFDISRKTGSKIFQRYRDLGLEGLTDRSRRPFRQANKLPMPIETLIVQLKREHPSWGAPKIREKLRRRRDDVQTPAISTVHAVLDRHGLVNHGRRRRYKAQGTRLSQPRRPNDLWCADYKGEFADRAYCYPLTITDFASRYLLGCESLGSTQEAYAFTVFQRVFRDFGLPKVIRTDNGPEFAGRTMQTWAARNGIELRFIQPGKPVQNAYIESFNSRFRDECLSQRWFASLRHMRSVIDNWRDDYNHRRPHSTLGYVPPALFAAQCRQLAGATAPTTASTTMQNLVL
jgi:putative transposase